MCICYKYNDFGDSVTTGVLNYTCTFKVAHYVNITGFKSFGIRKCKYCSIRYLRLNIWGKILYLDLFRMRFKFQRRYFVCMHHFMNKICGGSVLETLSWRYIINLSIILDIMSLNINLMSVYCDLNVIWVLDQTRVVTLSQQWYILFLQSSVWT